MADDGDRDRNQRDSIWSVARGAISLYFALFTTLFIAGIALHLWKGDPPSGDWASLVYYVWQESSSNAISSAAYSIIIIEMGRGLMVMAGWLEAKLRQREERRLEEAVAQARDKVREETRRETQEKTRKEERAKSRAWYARMREAADRGEPFDEPPPFAEDNANGKEPRS